MSRSTTSALPIVALTSSNAALFTTNLRLLNLDQRPDWPELTAQTFSTRDASQNQKHRIKCVEWALYRLFEIWDPEGTRDKLQPFFPPLEPLQSLNLRAALYRALNELKKDGVLGRESILRKSMLDECKGEKLLEILVVFSTVVLKRVLAAKRRKTKNTSAAYKFATARAVGVEDQRSLLPLAIAHKASLNAILRKKAATRNHLEDFDEFLGLASSQFGERAGSLKSTSEQARRRQTASLDTVYLQKQLRENWSTNPAWFKDVLYGNTDSAADHIFNQQFHEVWPSVAQGDLGAPVGDSRSLLEDLSSRVKEQNKRLHKWQAFHTGIVGVKDREAPADVIGVTNNRKEGIFTFDAHHTLVPGGAQESPSKSMGMDRPRSVDKYQAALARMKNDLLQATKSNGRAPLSISPEKIIFAKKSTEIRGLDETPVLPAPRLAQTRPTGGYPVKVTAAALQPTPGHQRSKSSVSRRAAAINGHQPYRPTVTPSNLTTFATPVAVLEVNLVQSPMSLDSTFVLDGATPANAPEDLQLQRQTKPRQNVAPPFFPPPSPPEEPESQGLAEQIILSAMNATPSPVKKPRRLSLIERTRMSMAHVSSLDDVESGDEPSPVAAVEAPTPDPAAAAFDRRASLLERTRQSMSQIQKPRKSSYKMHRQSLFPINQFETPKKGAEGLDGFEAVQAGKDATPTEVLFSENAEYDSVFKSRPKIALSPTATPREEEEDDTVQPLDGSSEWESSPLRRVGMTARSRG